MDGLGFPKTAASLRRNRGSCYMRSFKLSPLLAGTVILALAAVPASAASPTSSEVLNPAAASADKQPVQLADEIIRRLRRLGLNFTKNRLSHPYDPYFEIC